MPKNRAKGEFVWIKFGENQDTHHARLVAPMASNHPDDLDDDELVEICYTTSTKFDWVEKRNIEYPQPPETNEGQSSLSAGDTSITPSRRTSSRKRKSTSEKTTRVTSRTPSSSSSRKSIRSGGARKSSRQMMTKKLYFDGDEADENLRQAEAQRSKKIKNMNGTSSMTNKSDDNKQNVNQTTKPNFDDDDDDTEDIVLPPAKKLKHDEESSSSFFNTLTAPLMNIYNGIFGRSSTATTTH
jgi:hypothetical protein